MHDALLDSIDKFPFLTNQQQPKIKRAKPGRARKQIRKLSLRFFCFPTKLNDKSLIGWFSV